MNHIQKGAHGEQLVKQMLAAKFGGPADLMLGETPVEVKTAQPSKINGQGAIGWQFCLYRKGHTDYRKADLLILVALDQAGEKVAVWYIPVAELDDRKKIAVPEHLGGKWAKYIMEVA